MIFMDSNGIVINEMYFIVPRGTQSMAQQITIQNPFTISKTITLYGIESPTNQLGRASDTYQAQFFSTDGVNYSQSLQITIPGSSSLLIYTRFSPSDMAVPGDCEWTFHHEPNEDWVEGPLGLTKKGTITVTGSTDGAKTNYPVRVTISYQSFMRPDFGDMRFVGSDGSTFLTYNRVSYTASSTATFDVSIPSLPASPSTYILTIYSGNASVTDASNPNTVSLFYDDFPGTSLVSANYNAATGSISVSNSEVSLTNGYLKLAPTFTLPFEISYKIDSFAVSGDYREGININSITVDPTFASIWPYIPAIVSSGATNYNWVPSYPAVITLRILSTTHYQLLLNGTVIREVTNANISSPCTIYLQSGTNTSMLTKYDYISILQTTANPPTLGALSSWQDALIKDHDVEVKAGIQYTKAEIEGLDYNTSFGVRIGGNYYE